MEASKNEKAKIRKWILMAVATGKATIGVTIHHIRKFLDFKQSGISSKSEMKLILKKLLENGHLAKKDGKYVIKKSRKSITGKETKSPKSPIKFFKKPKFTTNIEKQTTKIDGSEPKNE